MPMMPVKEGKVFKDLLGGESEGEGCWEGHYQFTSGQYPRRNGHVGHSLRLSPTSRLFVVGCQTVGRSTPLEHDSPSVTGRASR